MPYQSRLTGTVAALALIGGLAACDMKKADPAATPSANTGVDRVDAAPTPTPAPPTIDQTVIQSQPGPSGSVVSLNKMKVTGDILTVQLTFTGKAAVPILDLDQISLIDDKTSQRIGMLKDDTGKWMASPLSSSGNDLQINLYQSPAVVWMKFPAPAATSPTVSLNIPEVAPFDGVAVTR